MRRNNLGLIGTNKMKDLHIEISDEQREVLLRIADSERIPVAWVVRSAIALLEAEFSAKGLW